MLHCVADDEKHDNAVDDAADDNGHIQSADNEVANGTGTDTTSGNFPPPTSSIEVVSEIDSSTVLPLVSRLSDEVTNSSDSESDMPSPTYQEEADNTTGGCGDRPRRSANGASSNFLPPTSSDEAKSDSTSNDNDSSPLDSTEVKSDAAVNIASPDKSGDVPSDSPGGEEKCNDESVGGSPAVNEENDGQFEQARDPPSISASAPSKNSRRGNYPLSVVSLSTPNALVSSAPFPGSVNDASVDPHPLPNTVSIPASPELVAADLSSPPISLDLGTVVTSELGAGAVVPQQRAAAPIRSARSLADEPAAATPAFSSPTSVSLGELLAPSGDVSAIVGDASTAGGSTGTTGGVSVTVSDPTVEKLADLMSGLMTPASGIAGAVTVAGGATTLGEVNVAGGAGANNAVRRLITSDEANGAVGGVIGSVEANGAVETTFTDAEDLAVAKLITSFSKLMPVGVDAAALEEGPTGVPAATQNESGAASLGTSALANTPGGERAATAYDADANAVAGNAGEVLEGMNSPAFSDIVDAELLLSLRSSSNSKSVSATNS